MCIATGPCSYTDHSQILCCLQADNTCGVNTVLEILLLGKEDGHVFDTVFCVVNLRQNVICKLRSNIHSHSARYNHPAKESVACDSLLQTHQYFLQPSAKAYCRLESNTGRNISDITHMIGYSFYLRKKRPDNLSPP